MREPHRVTFEVVSELDRTGTTLAAAAMVENATQEARKAAPSRPRHRPCGASMVI